MLDILLISVFFFMSFRIVRAVVRNSAVFTEFHQSKVLAFIAPLFPFGPLLLLLLRGQSLVLALVTASACYFPAFFLARRHIHAFEHAGTDRVREAMSASYQAFGTSIAGLVYIAAVTVLGFLMGQV